jgi:hypothetical protein
MHASTTNIPDLHTDVIAEHQPAGSIRARAMVWYEEVPSLVPTRITEHWAVLAKHKVTAVHVSVGPPVDGTNSHPLGICGSVNPGEAILTLVTGKPNASVAFSFLSFNKANGSALLLQGAGAARQGY